MAWIIYFLFIVFFVFSFFLKMIFILLSVAFTTLFERKILGEAQKRMGPNKMSMYGWLQPMIDAIKLLVKSIFFQKKYNSLVMLIGPMVLFLCWGAVWMILLSPFFYSNYFLMIFSFLAVSVFGLFFSGWGPIAKYSALGAIRSCSQSLSYEVSLFLVFMSWFMLWKGLFSYNFFISCFLLIPWLFLFFSILAETSRAPMDLSEGESEIISGFNIEYMSVFFVLLFLGEYMAIIFFSWLLSLLIFSPFFLHFFLLILVRSVYSRLRYDFLMIVCWAYLLPVVIFNLCWLLCCIF